MRIREVLLADALGAYWNDDQAAIRAGARQDGFAYVGSPRTPGFDAIRMPARALSIGLLLDDGGIAWGDMLTVQYAGAGGREPAFDPAAARELVGRELVPLLIGLDASRFRAASARADALPLPRAVRYGLGQALLGAAALATRRTMAEVLADEYGLPLATGPVPLFAQSGDERHVNVDKMILKRVDVLPHGLVNNRDKLGPGGATFLEYAGWVADRVRALGGADYAPVLHFDLYGTAGLEFDGDLERIADLLVRVEARVQPFALQIETPFDLGSRDAQLEGFARLRALLERRGAALRLVADEWCDTLADVREFARERAAHLVQVKMPDIGSLADVVEAVAACRAGGIGAYLGGSCAETDLSARVSVHVALATRPDVLLAKPGMGVDEALTIVGNEQARTLAVLRSRAGATRTTPRRAAAH